MLKPLSCALLLACAASVQAADWQRDFFSPMTNELPPVRGAVVDDLGYVHLQAFNRQPWAQTHDLVHQYTLAADGSVPWIWGLSQAEGLSDCGVYARAGQRLDCVLRSDWSGPYVQLEMRARTGSQVRWQAALPADAQLRAVSIPSEDAALVAAELDAGNGREIAIFSITPWGWVDVVSVAPACPQAGQVLQASSFAMPQDAFGAIRHAKACWNSFGTTDLIVEEFDRWSGLWTPLATQTLGFGEAIERIAAAADGSAYALTQDAQQQRQLWSTQPWAPSWQSQWFHPEGEPIAFETGTQGLLVALRDAAPGGFAPIFAWVSAQSGGWPQFRMFPQLADAATLEVAMSAEGDALVLRGDTVGGAQQERLELARADGQLLPVATLTLAPGETAAGRTHALPTPDGGVVVARTVQGSAEFGPDAVGVKVERYTLPTP